MNAPCRHKRKRSTVIFLEPNHEQMLPVAVLRVQCHECGQPFEFTGAPGAGMKLSADRRELRVTITEVSKWTVR
jgi:hypothetical protein